MKYIVQENIGRKGGEIWMDDPDQPITHEDSLIKAKGWMDEDHHNNSVHASAYEHRIIERSDKIVWPCVQKDEPIMVICPMACDCTAVTVCIHAKNHVHCSFCDAPCDGFHNRGCIPVKNREKDKQ